MTNEEESKLKEKIANLSEILNSKKQDKYSQPFLKRLKDFVKKYKSDY